MGKTSYKKKSNNLDDSSDCYKEAQTYKSTVIPPLSYWWYDPGVYNLDSIFIPTLYSCIRCYIFILIPHICNTLLAILVGLKLLNYLYFLKRYNKN